MESTGRNIKIVVLLEAIEAILPRSGGGTIIVCRNSLNPVLLNTDSISIVGYDLTAITIALNKRGLERLVVISFYRRSPGC